MNVTDDFHVIILTFILALRTAFSSEFYFSIHKTLFYSLPTGAGERVKNSIFFCNTCSA